jgi:hypothetical protein
LELIIHAVMKNCYATKQYKPLMGHFIIGAAEV